MEMRDSKLRRLSIFLIIAINIYGAFLESLIGIPRQVILVFPILLFIFSVFNDKKLSTKKSQILISAFLFIICIIQMLIFKNYDASFTMLGYFLVFLLCGINSRKEDLEIASKSIVIISIFMIIEAIAYYLMLRSWGWGTYNVRNFTSAPKEDYTIILSLAFAYLFVRYLKIKKGISRKYIVLLLMALELYINIIVMQSKTAIILAALVIVILYNRSEYRVRKRIKYILLVTSIIGILFIVFAKDYVPDFVYVFINRYTGLFDERVMGISDYLKYSGTYDQRNSIYGYCLKLISEHPLFGVGFGNFWTFSNMSSNNMINELTQAESGVLDAFVNGGIAYGIIYLIILLSPVIRAFKNGININIGNDLALVISLTLLICSITNDCNSVTFWLLLGCIFSLKKGYFKKRKNRLAPL